MMRGNLIMVVADMIQFATDADCSINLKAGKDSHHAYRS